MTDRDTEAPALPDADVDVDEVLADRSVRIVHEGSWIHPGGAARVAKALADAFDAPLTVGHTPDREFWSEYDVAFPFQERFHDGLSSKVFLNDTVRPASELLRAAGFRGLDFEEDVVISSGTAAKWWVPAHDQHHVHYCHVPPPRFYARPTDGVVDWATTTLVTVLDRHFADYCTGMLANSAFTRERVHKHYLRDRSEVPVVNPPIDVDRFEHAPADADDPYFVMIGRLNDMKRTDVVARAFRDLDARLVLVGDGPLRKQVARRRNVEVHERLSDDALADLVAESTGGIAFAREEHCGMTPKEFQSAGKPVVVPDEPNLDNHVTDGEDGVVVPVSEDGVRQGVERILDAEWDPDRIQQTAADWSHDAFREHAREAVARIVAADEA
ncbi:glycosyltransferase [Halorubellus salinus]|uniref:glycosyltransferase n=1 Tax=Halorubellus salinus TaxID=755309 RepID=UPI0022221DEE|nr:glycosyltransferase [Halorubellus salinus]